MNCKQDDLAVVVTSRYGNAGKVLTCLRLANDSDYLEHMVSNPMEPAWVVDIMLIGSIAPVPLVRDSSLRPLRDNPGTDETLLWAPVPSKLKEKA